MTSRSNSLIIVVSGAGPAADVDRLIKTAQQQDWEATVIATPNAGTFVDGTLIEEMTGQPLRLDYAIRLADTARTPGGASGLIIAPATFNTVNKIANGIADNYALTTVAEHIGLGTPMLVVPFVNTALAARAPFRKSIDYLQTEGVHVHWGPEHGWEPHQPGTGTEKREAFPWVRAFDKLRHLIKG